MQKTQLTTVKVLSGLYREFKKVAIDDNITLQLLLNTTINAYLHNPSYRDLILSASNTNCSPLTTGYFSRR